MLIAAIPKGSAKVLSTVKLYSARPIKNSPSIESTKLPEFVGKIYSMSN